MAAMAVLYFRPQHEFTRGTTNEKSDSQPKKIKKESLHKSFILNLTFVHLSLL